MNSIKFLALFFLVVVFLQNPTFGQREEPYIGGAGTVNYLSKFVGSQTLGNSSIFDNGNVGIGTNNPSTLFHTKSPANTLNELKIDVTSGNYKSILGLANNGTDYGQLFFDKANNNLYLYQKYTSGDLLLGTNSLTKITIKNNGNVGIGVTSPSAKLHLDQGTNTVGLRLNGSPTYGADIMLTDGVINTAHITQTTTGDLELVTDGGDIILNANVGIGTTTPDEKLTVNGKIHSKEVIVNLTGFPDFVFEEDYNLRSLLEVETFIKENKHLPEIPTAKEVDENGVSLGEMQTKLLQKIEELTLYIIEQEKRIKELENK